MPNKSASKRLRTGKLIDKKKAFTRHLADYAGAVSWEIDLKTNCFTHVDSQAVELLGFPVDEWYQENFRAEHLHPDDRDWVIRCCQDTAARDEEHDIEYRMIAADGSVVWVRDCVLIVRNESDPVVLRGHLFNITAQKQTIEALSRSKAEFEAMFNSLPIGVIFVDTERRIVMTNSA